MKKAKSWCKCVSAFANSIGGKFNIVGVEGVYISFDDVTVHGGQTDVDTTIAEVLRLIKENPQITRKVLSETIGIASSVFKSISTD